MYCTKCRAKIGDSNKCCTECGAKVEHIVTAQPVNQSTAVRSREVRKPAMIAGVVYLGVVLITGVAVFCRA